jgi:molybdenum cofactor guanylyltransferase
MGIAKAWLPFGAESMLARVVGSVGQVCGVRVVVAAQDQPLPGLPPEVIVARDRSPGCGPLEGLAAGMRALPPNVEAAFLTSCDVPLLVPELVRRLFELLGDHDAAVPVVEGHWQPLTAVYRTKFLPDVEQLLAVGGRGPVALVDAIDARLVGEDELRSVDPALDSLANINTPQAYLAVLEKLELPVPSDVLARFGARR